MCDYIKEFNKGIQGNTKNVPEDAITFLGVIASKNDYLTLENPELPTFYMNLHEILKHTCNPTLINNCITILEQAVKHSPKLRDALIKRYKFLPVLALLLCEPSSEVKRLLELLEELTYDIHFEHHEFYLDGLMKHLITMVQQQTEVSAPAFAVLVNLCFKNEECMYLVLRLIKIKELARLVDSYGIYTWKFYLIFDYNPDPKMLSQQVKLSFKKIEAALIEFDCTRLRHVVDFITSASRMTKGVEFEASLKKTIIERISLIKEAETEDEANREQKLMCIPLLFNLLTEILSSGSQEPDFISSVMNSCLEWLTITPSCVMKTISQVLRQQGLSLDKDTQESVENKISHFIKEIQGKKLTADDMILFFDMLLEMLKAPAIQNLVVKLVEDVFLEHLINEIAANMDAALKSGETSTYLRLFIYVLNTLYELSNIDTHKYYTKFRNLMQNPVTQKMLAQAFIVRDAKSYQMIFRMMRTSEFPLEEVSDALANQSLIEKFNNESSRTPKIIDAPPTATLEKRLIEVLDKLNEHPPQDLLTSEFVEIYKYNINSHVKQNEYLSERLSNSEATITSMSHQIQLLNTQIAKFQQDSFAKLLSRETILKENEVMQEQLKTVRVSMQQFSQKYDEAKKKAANLKESFEEKEAKLHKVLGELERVTEKSNKAEAEVKELQAEAKRRTEEFKQHFKTYEQKLKTCQSENETLTKSVQELEKQNTRLNDFNKSLEKQILMKDEQIKNYKDELQECEAMQQMIANAVSRRKKK